MDRPRIYQLLPRLFGNTNETRKPNGTLAENGVGKFTDISDTALRALRDELHITHIWLTGVHAQATATDWSSIGAPADDPDLLKGLAGSPRARARPARDH
jgi:neopullulanase